MLDVVVPRLRVSMSILQPLALLDVVVPRLRASMSIPQPLARLPRSTLRASRASGWSINSGGGGAWYPPRPSP